MLKTIAIFGLFCWLLTAILVHPADAQVRLEVHVPSSGHIADLSATLHNDSDIPIFLDPIYPQATAFLQYLDPVTRQWKYVVRVVRCATVDPEKQWRVDAGATISPAVLWEPYDSGKYEACLENEREWRELYEWRVKKGSAGDMKPVLPGGCTPPEEIILDGRLRLMMLYATEPWLYLSQNLKKRTVYSDEFRL